MLLGREFIILTLIPSLYKRHEDGRFRFSVNNYKTNFTEDESLKYLDKLTSLSIARIDREMIEIDSIEWIKFFATMLTRELKVIDNKMKCQLYDKDSLQFLYNEEPITKFFLNFSILNKNSFENQNIIHFCNPTSLMDDFFLSWFELLNDNVLVEHLFHFLQKKYSHFSFKYRRNFNFLDGLDSDYINQIFYNSIPDFFEKRGYKINRQVDTDTSTLLRVNYHQSELDSIELIDSQCKSIYLVKHQKSISFISVIGNTITMFKNEDVDDLENKLLKKMEDYSKINLLNKQKLLDISDKSIKLAWFFITLFNAILLFGNTKGVTAFKELTSSKYVLNGVAIALVVLTGLTFYLYTLPAIRLSLFKWSIDANKSKNS